MTRTRNSWPSSSSVSVRKSDTGGAGIQSVTIAVAIRLTSRVIETMTEIMVLLLRVGSSLARANLNTAGLLGSFAEKPPFLVGGGGGGGKGPTPPKGAGRG